MEASLQILQTNISNTLLLTIATVVSHSLACAYIGYHDIYGYWEDYRIYSPSVIKDKKPQQNIKGQKNEERWNIYKLYIPGVLKDFLITFPTCIFIVSSFVFKNYEGEQVYSVKFIAYNLLKMVIAYIIGRIWATIIHYWMHRDKERFQRLHSQHHVPLNHLCCVTSWSDSLFEFIVMEVPGSFLIGPALVGGMPLPFVLILAIYNAVTGAIDHSGFCVNEFAMNGIGHWVHHAEPDKNYSEFLIIDQFLGTLKSYEPNQVIVKHQKY